MLKKTSSKVAHNSSLDFFLVLAWLPKRPVFDRNRNLKDSLCLLSIYSLMQAENLEYKQNMRLLVTAYPEQR